MSCGAPSHTREARAKAQAAKKIASPPARRTAQQKASDRNTLLLRRYGISTADWEVVWGFQGRRCAGCYKSPKPGTRRYAVDHRHSDGLTRGILCRRCNSILGQAFDDADVLTRLADFLKAPPVTAALGEERYGRPGRVTKRRRARRKR